MSKTLNPILIPTGAVAQEPGGINIEQVIALSMKTANANELYFIMEKGNVENPVVWKMDLEATRDTEFGLLSNDSTAFAAGTALPFVTSSEDTVNPKTGAVISDPDGINMDKVIRVTKVDVGGVFKLVFTYMSINMQKTIEWSYALGSERNTVYGELTAPVAGLTFLS